MSRRLELLRAAVAARAASWGASRALEVELGFDDVPGKVDTYLHEQIATFASGLNWDDDVSAITEDMLDQLVKGLPS